VVVERNILFLMSGSIACAKATGLLSDWRKAGHAVRVATTASVSAFVGRATLEGLSGEPIFDDSFAAGQAMDHIHWAQWADLLVVCPATANLLAKFANGIADDAVTTLWQAAWGRGVPLFIVPAMNTQMWDYPATAENVARLRSWGVHVLPTAEGQLACGETGAGRMLEPARIREQIEALLAFDKPPKTGQKVLVTGGGTREPIDAVRYLGNHSTGRTAAQLTDELTALGHEVTWLGGAAAVAPSTAAQQQRFESFADLSRALQQRLAGEHFDAVIHAAAVSDFSVRTAALETVTAGEDANKLGSDSPLTLQLAPNPKLLDQLKGWSRNEALRVVGFKLTAGADDDAARSAVARQFARKGSDLVVHNDTQAISAGRHVFDVYRPDGSRVHAENALELARQLSDFLGADQ